MSMDFIEFCRDCGIVIDTLPPYGVWSRYPTVDHPRKRNGAVKWMESHGLVQNHAVMSEPRRWVRNERTERPLSQDEVRRARERAQIQKRKEQNERAAAIGQMRECWKRLPALRDNHPYLNRKGLSMQGCGQLRIDRDLLVIPLYRKGELVSLQTIDPEGNKKFRHNCPVKGATYCIQRRNSVVTCFCEGFATGLAIYQSIPGASVEVCFNAANLVEVARQRKVSGMTVVCADNDWQTAKKAPFVNPGIERGTEAAKLMKCGLAYPEGIEGSDWDDARREWGEKGSMKVKMEIMRKARMVIR